MHNENEMHKQVSHNVLYSPAQTEEIQTGFDSTVTKIRNDGFTFGTFDKLYVHDFLSAGLSSSNVKPDDAARLLQCLHGSTVSDVSHVYIVYSQDTVIHPAQGDARVNSLLLGWVKVYHPSLLLHKFL